MGSWLALPRKGRKCRVVNVVDFVRRSWGCVETPLRRVGGIVDWKAMRGWFVTELDSSQKRIAIGNVDHSGFVRGLHPQRLYTSNLDPRNNAIERETDMI